MDHYSVKLPDHVSAERQAHADKVEKEILRSNKARAGGGNDGGDDGELRTEE